MDVFAGASCLQYRLDGLVGPLYHFVVDSHDMAFCLLFDHLAHQKALGKHSLGSSAATRVYRVAEYLQEDLDIALQSIDTDQEVQPLGTRTHPEPGAYPQLFILRW
jgi:hypothetical protein